MNYFTYAVLGLVGLMGAVFSAIGGMLAIAAVVLSCLIAVLGFGGIILL